MCLSTRLHLEISRYDVDISRKDAKILRWHLEIGCRDRISKYRDDLVIWAWRPPDMTLNFYLDVLISYLKILIWSSWALEILLSRHLISISWYPISDLEMRSRYFETFKKLSESLISRILPLLLMKHWSVSSQNKRPMWHWGSAWSLAKQEHVVRVHM